MYEYLRGELAGKSLTEAVIDIGGVGYRVEVSLRTAERMPPLHTQVFILVHHRPQEDRVRLFGFIDEAERTLFRELLGISGIGPAIALALLAGHEPEEVWKLLRDGEWKAIARTKGIGPKIAQRACTELKDRARRFALSAGAAGSTAAPANLRINDAIDALLVLGYSDDQAQKAVELARKASGEEATLEDLVRLALKHA